MHIGRGGRRGGRFGPPGGGGGGFPARSPVFDINTCSSDIFSASGEDESYLNEAISEKGAQLSLAEASKTALTTFTKKVKETIEKIKTDNVLPELKIEEVHIVGSLAKDTDFFRSSVSDIAVVLRSLPTVESTMELGEKVVQELRKEDDKEVISFYQREFGCQITSLNAQVKILVTTLPENSSKLEPDLHLSEKSLMINYFSIRHAKWFAEVNSQYHLRDLVRVLKDVRQRHVGLHPLSVWALELLSLYCVTSTQNRQPLSLGHAFRRIIQVIATGIFLHGAPPLVDPTNPLRIAFDLTLPEMDVVCLTAHTLLRIMNSGPRGFRAVVGLDSVYANEDLTKEPKIWDGVLIAPGQPVFSEECMTPMFSEQDEALADKMGAVTTH
ncbi:unnamed protein product [Caenorhabditis auriculariae]|uniref:DZF domain-containing protein n=1 Tax=Caenorhabditis auriculariae TaxID=2777116 RepID=A0A8S1HHG9_9PELO|nr:unnamed protein product [Caenorhabditis auriculariae]